MNNIVLNRYDIQAYEMAVSKSDGQAVIYDRDSEHIYSVTVNKNLSRPDEKVKEVVINTVKLSTFIEKESLEKIDLIKLDVETHEAEVLKGMENYLARFTPTFLIEILTQEVAKEVNKLFSGLGYLFFDIDEIGAPKQVPSIERSSYFNYLVCQPRVATSLGLKFEVFTT
ncbi:MAG: hypothetical protein OHK0053_00770 [Microscillaceae bacterium]